jgi:hypothetical protein
MATTFTPPRSDEPVAERIDVTADFYLTDGEGLYRTLGQTADENERLVCVEDCVTLDVLLVPLATVLALRPVVSASSGV